MIRAAGFEARVNAYVVGQTRRTAGGSSFPSSTYSPHASQTPRSPDASPPSHPFPSHSPYTPPGLSSQSAEGDQSPGCPGATTDLWYLSLVGARGQGTTMRALWANLVSNRVRSVWLEGVGSVTLGQHRLDLTQLGYSIHWTYRQGVVTPGREIHGILEADALSCYDPLLVPETSRKRARPAGAGRGGSNGSAGRAGNGGRSRAEGAAVTLSTQSTTGPGGSDGADEAAAREARPLFLLLVRGGRMRLGSDSGHAEVEDEVEDEVEQRTILAKQHLRFLSTRIGWLPYYPPWAAYLWERARERGEAERLRTWCYAPPSAPAPAPELPNGGSGEETAIATSTPGAPPFLVGAYLCHPDPLALTADLQWAIKSGVFRTSSAESAAGRTGTLNQPEVAA